MHYSIFPLGDSALIINFGEGISEELNHKVHALKSSLDLASLPGVKDIVPAYSSLSIHYDPLVLRNKAETAFQFLSQQVEELLTEEEIAEIQTPRQLRIPVCYARKYAIDLEEISRHTGLAEEEIISLHHGATYRVYTIGFLPGFAYMGKVDDRIAIPRRAEPRAIKAGFVGIAGNQTGIYPLPSPGGWQIIGRTPLRIFDASAADPVLFRAGDEVQFYPISEDEFDHY